MARTFSGTATTVAAVLTVSGTNAVAVSVKNRGTVEDLLVSVDAVHGTDFDRLSPGETEYYRDPGARISSVSVKTETGTADYFVAVTEGSK